MFHPTLGIDDEQLLFAASDGGSPWFSQGRFLIGLIQLIVPQPVTPLFPYLLLASSYVASYTLIISIHGLHHCEPCLLYHPSSDQRSAPHTIRLQHLATSHHPAGSPSSNWAGQKEFY
jgi:hypothetical protein